MTRYLYYSIVVVLLGALLYMAHGIYAPLAASASVSATALIPAPMQMPSSGYILKTLLIITFFVHFILVNIVLGSAVLATVNAFKKTPLPGGTAADAAFMPDALALAVNFGVAPLLFAQVVYESLLYSSSVLMALWWLAVPLLVMFTYYALYISKGGSRQSNGWRRLLLLLITLLLLFIAFILVTNNTLMLRPDTWPEWFKKPGGNMLNTGDAVFAPRYLFVLFSALAVGGLFMAARSAWRLRGLAVNGAEAERLVAGGNERIKYGLHCYQLFLLLQFCAGLWLLFALPQHIRAMFTGGGVWTTLALALAITGGACAILAARNGKVWAAVCLEFAVMLVLIVARDMTRVAMLAPYAGAKEALPLPVRHGQDAAFAFFLFCAVIGVTALVWILRVAMQAFNAQPHERAKSSGGEGA